MVSSTGTGMTSQAGSPNSFGSRTISPCSDGVPDEDIRSGTDVFEPLEERGVERKCHEPLRRLHCSKGLFESPRMRSPPGPLQLISGRFPFVERSLPHLPPAT